MLAETTMAALFIGYFTAIAIVCLACGRSQHRKTSLKKVTDMKIPAVLALAFTLTTGMVLTAAFGLGLLPPGF